MVSSLLKKNDLPASLERNVKHFVSSAFAFAVGFDVGVEVG